MTEEIPSENVNDVLDQWASKHPFYVGQYVAFFFFFTSTIIIMVIERPPFLQTVLVGLFVMVVMGTVLGAVLKWTPHYPVLVMGVFTFLVEMILVAHNWGIQGMKESWLMALGSAIIVALALQILRPKPEPHEASRQ